MKKQQESLVYVTKFTNDSGETYFSLLVPNQNVIGSEIIFTEFPSKIVDNEEVMKKIVDCLKKWHYDKEIPFSLNHLKMVYNEKRFSELMSGRCRKTVAITLEDENLFFKALNWLY
jgi:hypothetical protein